MKKSISITTFLVLIITALVSCKKDEETKKESSVPALSANIQIAQPIQNAIIAADSVVYMNATITADFHMHGYHAWLINSTTNDTVWTTDSHSHGESMLLSSQWTNNVAVESDMLFKITATLDHDGATETKSVAFKCLAH